MKKTFHTPDGIFERDLEHEEIVEMAKMGDIEAREHLARSAYSMATTDSERIRVIADFLGISTPQMGWWGRFKKRIKGE